jgi:S-formylglutathione hydrolase FrmB
MKLLGDVFGSPPDRAFWDRNNPLALARTAPIARLKIYFDCGADDGYGFDAGARTLDEILTSRGIRHEFHIYPGGHDWPYFAEHLPASLEFESRAFGVIPVAK